MLAGDGTTVSQEKVLGAAFVSEPIGEGDLTMKEAVAFWDTAVAAPSADRPAFLRFYAAIDDLFEYEEEEEDGEVVVMEEEEDAPASAALPDSETPGSSDPAVEVWLEVSEGEAEVSRDEAFSCAFVVDPLRDGDLSLGEAQEIWKRVVGSVSADQEAFVQFYAAIEELFVYVDEEEEDMEPQEMDADMSAVRDELADLLAGMERAGIDCDEDVKARITELVGGLEASIAQQSLRGTVEADDRRLAGTWSLVYTSSSSFGFNEGFTGVAKTTPGGAEFGSLEQVIKSERLGSGNVATETSFTETLRVAGGSLPLEVSVKGAWELKRRMNLMSADEEAAVIIDVTPQELAYGPVEVRGDRVEIGWKSMRVLNGAVLRYLEPSSPEAPPAPGDLRIMFGSNGPSSMFIFQRIK